MPNETAKTYLLHAKVAILGGGLSDVFDAVKAKSAKEAENKFKNSFHLNSGDNAVSCGRVLFLPGTVASLTVTALCIVDDSCPFNEFWLNLAETTENWEEELKKIHESE